MASRALHHIETESIATSIWPSAALKVLIAELPQAGVTQQPGPPDEVNISRIEALQGAKGVLIAVGVEAAAGLCLCGIWNLWVLLR